MLILLVLVVASWWLLQKPGAINSTATAVQRGPDMFADHIEVTVMGESGRPEYRIRAEQLRHSPDKQRFDLTRPEIEVNHHDGGNWNIVSENGQMNDKGDQMWFLGEVNIHRHGDNSMHIRTRDILVKPDEELAETDSAVSITAANYEIDAIGLKADFRNKRLQFRSSVRGKINAAS